MPALSSLALALLTLSGLSACGDDGPDFPSGGGGDGGTSERCPEGMIEVAEVQADLGEWDEGVLADYPGTVLPQASYDLGAYCIGTYPLPGFAGQAWPQDGLAVDQLPAVEDLLGQHGRRLCTVGELLHAAAGPENWRHPYDPEQRQEGVCDPDDQNPSLLGAYSGCESPLGLRDLEVRSSWALLDTVSRAGLEEHYPAGFPGDGTYVAWGGTSSPDTFYAPSNFGLHFHGEDEDAYVNNGLRICSEVDQVDDAQEQAWQDQLELLLDFGTFAGWLTGGATTGGTTGGSDDTGDTGA